MAHPLRPNHLPHPHGPLPWLPGLLHEPASAQPGAGHQAPNAKAAAAWRIRFWGMGSWVPRRHPPQRCQAGHRFTACTMERPVPSPKACGVRCEAMCAATFAELRAQRATHLMHYQPQHCTTIPWCKPTPHAATGNQQPATGNRQALHKARAAADLADFTARPSAKVTLR